MPNKAKIGTPQKNRKMCNFHSYIPVVFKKTRKRNFYIFSFFLKMGVFCSINTSSNLVHCSAENGELHLKLGYEEKIWLVIGQNTEVVKRDGR